MTIVYVGGERGDIPYIVTTSLKDALKRTAEYYSFHGPDDSYNEQWICEFIDGEPDGDLRWTCEFKNDAGNVESLYVEMFDLELP